VRRDRKAEGEGRSASVGKERTRGEVTEKKGSLGEGFALGGKRRRRGKKIVPPG